MTAEENSPPTMTSVEVRGGYLGAEGETSTILEVTVADPDWNVDSVVADLSNFGLGVVELNDRGLNGDADISDGIFSYPIRVSGSQIGNLSANITITDAFDAISENQATLFVSNPGPRLLSVDIVPSQASRGDLILVDAVAYDQHGVERVALDLRPYGGEVVEFTENTLWSASFIVPNTITPGERVLTFILEDEEGARTITSMLLEDGATSTDALTGPWSYSDDNVAMNILNDAPQINGLVENIFDKQNTPKTALLEVNVTDPDGIASVIVSLGVYRPITMTNDWTQMRDDGQGGDRVAGDNIWTAEISIRDGTPLGVHEVEVRASDSYGKVSVTESYPVSLVEGNTIIPQGEDGLSSVLTIGGIGLLFLAGAVFLILGGKKDENRLAKDDQAKELEDLQNSIQMQRNN